MKQFPRPMLEELHFRNHAAMPAKPQEAQEPLRDLMGPSITAARIDALLGPTDADFFSQMSAVEARDVQPPVHDQHRLTLQMDPAEFMRQMSLMEARSLADLCVEAGGRRPGQGSISREEAGTMRAVPQEQWDSMCKALRAAQVQLEILALVFRSYEAHHREKKTEESDYKAAVNQAHATSSSALAKMIQEVLK